MRSTYVYILVCILAMAIPFFPYHRQTQVSGFPGWPQQLAGSRLRKLPLSQRETQFAENFPGKVARFSDGKREIIIRWVVRSTRKLHPASDCFRGFGYQIQPRPIYIDKQGHRWGSLIASKKNERIQIYERIYDEKGNSWTDVSSWYWAALMGKSDGPWWVITLAEKR